MEKHIKDVFARMDLQHIRAFVLTGAKELHPQSEAYEVRIMQASDPISKRIDSPYSDTKELDKATTELVDALTAYQDVYFEIGMKFGARLAHKLLMTDNFTDRGQAQWKYHMSSLAIIICRLSLYQTRPMRRRSADTE